MVYMSLVVNLIGQRSRDVIGRLSVNRDVIGCEKTVKSDWCISIRLLLVKKSVGLLLVKLLSNYQPSFFRMPQTKW